ncbi:MAG: M6 family metalloprotease domain-containing protein [Bacteroidia bacterium]
MRKIILLGFLYLTGVQVFAQRSNCSVSPEPNTFTQQDGSIITLVALGNEQENYLETLEGYTVLVNDNNIFEYAYIDAKGNLSPSGIKATNKTTFSGKNSFSKNLRYSKIQKAILAEAFSQLAQNNDKNLGKAGPQGFPAKGINKVCVLLIQYPDLLATNTKSVYENLFNQLNYGGNGSVKDYYYRTSFGQLTLNSDVYGWYMADMNSINYGKSNTNYSVNTRDLVRDAVVAADSAGVDFSQYDNDLDGKIDGLLILHSGIGAEEQSAPNANNYIWSFRSTYFGSLLVDGKSVSSYCMFPEKRYSNASYPAVGIGVITHEFGHILDLPDLYSTQSKGEGAGNFTNMAGGPWLNGEKTPCLFDAWSKMALEWHTPTIISQIGTYTIPKCAADSNFSYRINTSKTTEYFLLENKQLKGNDKFIPGKGLAIWHINANYAKLLSGGGGNNVNNDTSKYGTGLMQADGQRHLEKGTNRGDGGDLFPGTSNNRNFSGSTNPSSNFYPTTAGGVRASTNVTISNITLNPDSSITFTLGSKAIAAFDGGSLKGCVPHTISFKNNSLFAKNFKWNFGDGSAEDTTLNPTYTFTQVGNYPVKLYVLDSLNNAIDSITQTYVISASPDAIGTVTRINADSFYFENKSANADYVSWKMGNSSSNNADPFGFKFSAIGVIPVKLIAYKASCTDTFKWEIDVWNTSISENKMANNIVVYPNPFGNELNISFESKANQQAVLTITNVLGQQVFSNKMNTKAGVNLFSLNNANSLEGIGIYIVKLTIDNQTYIYKIMKNN